MKIKFFKKILLNFNVLMLIFGFIGFHNLILPMSNLGPKEEIIKNEENQNKQENATLTLNTNNFASYYFSNLTTNFGDNIKGSCTLVAAEMLLSFYDTYWDDNIIDEKYEQNSYLDEDSNIFECKVSPGTKNDYFYDTNFNKKNFTTKEYWDYVVDTKDKLFHSYLIYEAEMKYDLYHENEDEPMGIWLDELLKLLNDYFFPNNFGLFKKISIYYSDFSPLLMRNSIIENVKNGVPVIVDAFSEDGEEGHSFIAYDYDEKLDEIICHSGWLNRNDRGGIYSDNPHTITTMEQMGYTDIREILYLKHNGEHVHSNNYIGINEYGEEEKYCSCITRYPINLTVEDFYLDELPTFRWNSLINEKWYSDIGLKFQFSILNANRVKIVEINNLTKNYYKLKTSNFIQAVDSFSDNFYIKIGVVPTKEDVNGYDDIFLLKEFKEPSRYLYKTQIKPHEWGIHPRYYFQNEIDSNEYYKYTTIVKGGISISTQRLRCGYIENRFINLSPRREDAGYAYFQMEFDVPIYSFMFGVCLWSNYEYLDDATLKIKNSNNEWVDFINITDDLELKVKEEGVNRYHHLFDEGIYGLKFECYAEAVGDRNKGRLCIDDIVLCKEKDPFYNRYYGTNYEL